MESPDFEKSKIYIIAGMEDFSNQKVVVKDILKRATGNIRAVFVDRGHQLTEQHSRFDHFIHILEGKAEVLIDNRSYNLSSGQSIIIPAHSTNSIKASEKFKMISTIIKSGYE